MAYRCPVCASPEVDGEHLANHLAFTAVIRGDDHEAWLDEHVPGWSEMGPGDLAPKVVEAVPEVDLPELEDADGDGQGDEHGHEHGGGRLEEELARQGSHRGPGATGGESGAGRGDLTDEAAGVMAEARELTKEMYGLDEPTDAEDADAGDAEDADGGDAEDADAGDAEDAEDADGLGESSADAGSVDADSESETE